MTAQLTSYLAARTATSGEMLTGPNSTLTAPRDSDLKVRPGESDPTRALGAVLVLTVVTVIVVVGLVVVWWLA